MQDPLDDPYKDFKVAETVEHDTESDTIRIDGQLFKYHTASWGVRFTDYEEVTGEVIVSIDLLCDRFIVDGEVVRESINTTRAPST